MKSILFALLIALSLAAINKQEKIPIYFQEFGIQIRSIDKLGDTIYNKKSSKENFKLVFYDIMGKCYCERFINGKLYEKGNFINSLDTLKSYISGRDIDGNSTPKRVYKFFEPLRDGEWVIYEKGKERKVKYILGSLVKD